MRAAALHLAPCTILRCMVSRCMLCVLLGRMSQIEGFSDAMRRPHTPFALALARSRLRAMCEVYAAVCCSRTLVAGCAFKQCATRAGVVIPPQ